MYGYIRQKLSLIYVFNIQINPCFFEQLITVQTHIKIKSKKLKIAGKLIKQLSRLISVILPHICCIIYRHFIADSIEFFPTLNLFSYQLLVCINKKELLETCGSSDVSAKWKCIMRCCSLKLDIILLWMYHLKYIK